VVATIYRQLAPNFITREIFATRREELRSKGGGINHFAAGKRWESWCGKYCSATCNCPRNTPRGWKDSC